MPPAVSENKGIVDMCSEPITFCVCDQHGEETYFKVNKTAKMELVFDVYAQRKGLQATDGIRFSLHNKEIGPHQTPNELQLKADDKIDCVVPTLTLITIRVCDETGKETHFKLQETTKMQEVLDWYAQHKWIDGRSRMYLKLDGVTIHPEHTPKMLELEDQDVIHLVIKRLVLVPDSTPITIRLRFYAHKIEDTFFRIKKCTPMLKVFESFGERKGISVSSYRFLLDGEKIHGDSTPQELELEDHDVIDVVVEQSGT